MTGESKGLDGREAFSEDAWVEVLRSVDQTYQELVSHQIELEKRNAELEAVRGFLTSVLGAMSDVLIACGPDGEVLEANRAYVELVRQRRSVFLGTRVLDAFDPGEREGLAADLAGLRLGQPVPIRERLIRTPEGATPVELSVTVRLDRRRRPVGAVLIGRPVGELRRAYRDLEAGHEALKAAQSQLVHSEKLASLGRLLAGVAHELNNPISFVYGNAHALERYTEKFETYFARVEERASQEELIALRAELKLDRAVRNMRSAVSGALEGAERVRDIVDSLRRLSAEGTGGIERFDLVQTAETGALWVVRGRGSDRRTRLDADGRVMALGRPGHIQQVVMNLVQNALDATEEGPARDAPVELRVFAERGRAVLEVADRGPGIAPEVAMRVFDPFFTTKPVGKGTGLGLSISYKIVEENRGTLTFRAREGGGTVFRLELPGGDGDE